MGETPIAPWQIMKAAHDAEHQRWNLYDLHSGKYEIRRDNEGIGELMGTGIYEGETASAAIAAADAHFEELRESASWRAALRALAEMELDKYGQSAIDTHPELMRGVQLHQALIAIEHALKLAASEGENS